MSDPIAPRGYVAAYEGAQECHVCDGAGFITVWAIGDTCCPADPCERCGGTGKEPAPDAKPVTSEAVERALSRAEETTMARPDNTSIHHYGSIGKLAMRLVSDYAIPSDRAASVAAAVGVTDGDMLRACWLSCVLPHPAHKDRVAAAEALMRECGFANETKEENGK